MRTILFRLLATGFLVATRANAADPTARDLIARVPVVSSADAGVKSLDIAGYWAADGKITRTFRALYQAPDHFAFLTSDGDNAIPNCYTVDRRTLVYDPVRPELVLYRDSMQYFECGARDGKPNWSFGHKVWTRDPDRIVIDFKAMFGAPDEGGAATRETLVRTGDGQFTLVQRRKKLYIRSRVDLNRKLPFTTLELAEGPEADPYFCVDRIIVDGKLSATDFAFPAKERLAALTGFREVNDETLRNEFDAARLFMGTFQVRENLRKESEGLGLIGPACAAGRLARVAMNDETVGAALKAMIPAGPAHTLAGRPARKDDPDTIRPTTYETIRGHLPRLPFKFSVKIK